MFGVKGNVYEFLIAGLGNPGMQYDGTRHNAGFMAADKIAEKYGCVFSKHKFDAVYTDITIASKRGLLVKPQTYMNLSGKAITAIMSFYKIPIENVIVMFDDISLDVGKIRLRRKGSAGGHNGIKDIIELCGTEEIARIKIGVGAKPHPDYDLKDWVLGKIPKEQKDNFEKALDNVVCAAQEIIKAGIDSAMNKYSK